MDNIENSPAIYFGIEQHFDAAALTYSKIDTVAELQSLHENGVSLESPLIASLESLVGIGQLSTENLKDKIAELWKRFLDSLVRGWDYFISFIDTVYTQVRSLLSNLSDLSDAAKQRVGSYPKNKSVDVTRVYKGLMYNNKALDPKDFRLRVNEMAGTMNSVLLDHVVEVMNVSKFISPLVESLITVDVSNPNAIDKIRTDARAIAKFGNEVHDHIQSLRGDDVSSERYDLTSGDGITHVKRVASLLGNKAIYVKHGNVDKAALRGEGIPFFTAISTVFNSGMIMDSTDSNQADREKVEFKTLTPEEVIEIADSLKDVLSPIMKFKQRYDNDLKTQRKRYQQLRGKLSVMARSGDNAEVTLYLRRIGIAAMGLSRWYYEPFIPLINHSLRVVRSSIVYGEKSLSQWPVK